MGSTKDDQVAVEIDGHEENWTVKDVKRWVDLH
jgi:hypothetical protein